MGCWLFKYAPQGRCWEFWLIFLFLFFHLKDWIVTRIRSLENRTTRRQRKVEFGYQLRIWSTVDQNRYSTELRNWLQLVPHWQRHPFPFESWLTLANPVSCAAYQGQHLKAKTVGCFETSAINNYATRHSNIEDLKPVHQHQENNKISPHC